MKNENEDIFKTVGKPCAQLPFSSFQYPRAQSHFGVELVWIQI